MVNVKVNAKSRQYTFEDVERWDCDGVFLSVLSKNGERRLISYNEMIDILIENVETETKSDNS